jgi:hypothetical protein
MNLNELRIKLSEYVRKITLDNVERNNELKWKNLKEIKDGKKKRR